MNRFAVVFALAVALGAAGCWTFDESAYPETAVTAAAEGARHLSLQVAGFESTMTEYETVNGFETVYVPGYYGRHHFRPGYYETVPTTAVVARQRATDRYLAVAKDEFETAGFTLAAANPQYIVEGTFEGPFTVSGDGTAAALWPLCTAFFCDYASQNWSAKLRIREAAGGRLVFHHEYVQRYETKVFALVPLFGPAGCEETGYSRMKGWCLSALTDRMVADAAAFLNTLPAK